ncbi:MAG: xanthine dehydrogenase family protein molybdopterin-binding subunit [Firmicutes bacterium]|nr:xanthine dehydrogenase family protein molybdopterin-binding subunit [Alicyclobacillaceae bacterium]MCL6497427.1 xanthine dehydrogenase family protein molybdopterin-binding subunit [Bacillota bacterium]
MPRIDAPAKVRGTMAYTADVARPRLCHAALVRSPFPHARIVHIDAAAARALPGVLGVFTAEDFPARTYGRIVQDVPLLAREQARYAGEPVAVVVAESRTLADRAAAKVRVDYEPLSAVLDPEQALAPDAPRVHSEPWAYPGAVVTPESGPNLQSVVDIRRGGDVEAALSASAHVVDQIYTTPAGQHGYLEPQAFLAEVDPDGKMHLWVTNKSPYRLRAQVAAVYGVAPETVEVHPVAIGGDFGGKGSVVEPVLCLELARRLGRPVRLQLRYNEDLAATDSRHAGRIRVRLGADASGRLTALCVDALFNGGAYAGYKPVPSVELFGVREAGSPYRIPALAIRSRIAYTHTLPGGHMRAPGSPQTVFAVESALDELAAKVGIDPITLRRNNLLTTGEADAHGHRALEHRGLETLDAALAAVARPPIPAGWRYGLGVALYNRGTRPVSTSLRLEPEADGAVTAVIPTPETGTGSHTVVHRALVRALALPPEKVRVRQGSTSELPHDDGVGGSWVTVTLLQALDQALAAFRARGGTEAVEVIVRPEEVPPVTSYCAEVAEVAVDPETGEIRVLNLVAAVDVADIINPVAHQIQLEGGLAMGYGFAVMEDVGLEDGRVTAANLGEFKIPSSRDLPPFRIVLVEGGKGIGPNNIKGVGELTNVPTAAAIANAVAAATGVRLRTLPLSAERLFWALAAEGTAAG